MLKKESSPRAYLSIPTGSEDQIPLLIFIRQFDPVGGLPLGGGVVRGRSVTQPVDAVAGGSNPQRLLSVAEDGFYGCGRFKAFKRRRKELIVFETCNRAFFVPTQTAPSRSLYSARTALSIKPSSTV